MANMYDIGDLVRVGTTFKNSADTLIDPTAVYVKYRTPAGVTTTLTYGVDAALVRDSLGTYHADVSITETGTWHYRWYSTGTGQGSEEHYFEVRQQVVA